MADKIVVMQEGRIEQLGSPLELYNRPNNLFVATFIGAPSMNLIEGVYSAADNAVLAADGIRQTLAGRPQVTDGRRVVYGIRPEHLGVAETGMRATVKVVEPTGSETLVFARVGSADVVALLRDQHEFRPNETVHLEPQAARAHLFDAETGERLGA